MIDNGIDITRYAWVRNRDGYFLYSVGGPRIGAVVSFPPKCWGAYSVQDRRAAKFFDTRRKAGRWLVEQWEGKGNG